MNKIKKLLLIFIAILLIIFATLFIVAGIANEQIISQLRQNGISVQATIIGKEIINSEKYSDHQIKVEYLTTDGDEFTKAIVVNEDNFMNFQRNQEITITYVPDKPDWVVIGESFSYDRRPFYLAITAFVFGFLLLFMAFSSFRIIKILWNKKN